MSFIQINNEKWNFEDKRKRITKSITRKTRTNANPGKSRKSDRSKKVQTTRKINIL